MSLQDHLSVVQAIGVWHCSDMRDNFVSQMASMHMPHGAREQLQGDSSHACQFDHVRCLIGWITYLMQLTCGADDTILIGTTGFYAPASAYLSPLPPGVCGSSIFSTRLDAQEYIERLIRLDMEYRSIKTDRIQSSLHRIRATFYLAYGVVRSADRLLWNLSPSCTIDESFTLSEDCLLYTSPSPRD